MKTTGILLLILSSLTSQAQQSAERKHQFVDQAPPGRTPVKFAPGIVSMPNRYEFGSIFSKDGTEFYFAMNVNRRAETMRMKLERNGWSKPERFLFDSIYSYNDPFFSPDQKRLYVISDRPLNGSGPTKDYDIWYIERKGNKWSDPINAGPEVNSSGNDYYISFSSDGALYFGSNRKTDPGASENYDLHRAAFVNGKFQKAVNLGQPVNTEYYEADVFVSPDETFMVFCGDRPEGMGKGDLYVSFRNEDGTWAKAKNMGDRINTAGHEFCPFITSDGRYLFYTSNGDIFWVDAQIISELK